MPETESIKKCFVNIESQHKRCDFAKFYGAMRSKAHVWELVIAADKA